MRFCATLAIAAGLCATPAAAATVVVGVPNWPSAQVTAYIIASLLEDELGHEARMRDIGTIELFDAIDRGEVDVHPEVWRPNLDRFVGEYVEDRGTVTLSSASTEASQHLCTTRQTHESIGLTRVADLADPEIAAKFDTDSDGRGEVWIGAHEWSSTRVERVRAQSYGYADTMLLLTMPEELAMAAVDAAVVTGAPIVFYCYRPHYVFELHDIVTLEEPAHDPARWEVKSPEDDPAWLAASRAETAWEPSNFQVGYATSLEDDAPDVAAFLSKVTIRTNEATAMSYAIDVEGRDPAEVAAEWVANNEARWSAWVK